MANAFGVFAANAKTKYLLLSNKKKAQLLQTTVSTKGYCVFSFSWKQIVDIRYHFRYKMFRYMWNDFREVTYFRYLFYIIAKFVVIY